MLFINRFSHIRNCSLIQQGNPIFGPEKTSLDDFLERAFKFLAVPYPKFYKMDRISKLGFLAAEVLLPEKTYLQYPAENVAVVFSNAYSSLDTDFRFQESVKIAASPALFVYTLPNIVIGEVCIRHGIKGENAFFIFPEFSASQMVDYVEFVMAGEKTEACVAGWVDVMSGQHDVFLYLVEKKKNKGSVPHSAAELQKIYTLDYGKVDR